MTVLPDRLTFRGGFDLAEAGTYAYSFKFKDSEGVDTVDPPRYEIEAIADQVPQVTIDAPAADATVTANAQIPVTVTAKDDWGLRDLQLRFHVGESSEANAPTVALATGLPRSEHHRASIVWPLGGLSVSEGMRIVFPPRRPIGSTWDRHTSAGACLVSSRSSPQSKKRLKSFRDRPICSAFWSVRSTFNRRPPTRRVISMFSSKRRAACARPISTS